MRLLVIISNIIILALVSVLLLTAPPEIPLYYSRAWGESQIASKWELLLFPILMNIAFFITHWFIKRKFIDDEIFARIARVVLFFQTIIVTGILIRTFWLLSH